MQIPSHYKLISCEVGPNYQLDDGLLALNLLWSKTSKKPIIESELWFQNFFQTKQNFHFTDNGRTGLYLLLKSLNLEPGSEVLIQGFSCVVLPNSVWQAGLKPLLVDVEKETYNFDIQDLKSKISPKTKVLILQYTFGLVPNISEITQICQENNLVLIEDCAHSLGAEVLIEGKQQKIGSLGQGAFFSFGRDKIVSSTVGGAVYVNPRPIFKVQNLDLKQFSQELAKNYDQLPEISGKRLKQALIYAILTSVFIRPLYHFQIGKVILLLARKLNLIGEIYTDKEKQGTNSLETNSKYHPKLASLLNNQLAKFDKLNQHRRDLSQIYAQNLNLKFSKNQVYMRFPLKMQDLMPDTELSKSKKKEVYFFIKQKLRKNGILIGTWYTSLFMQPEMDYSHKFEYKIGNLPNAEDLCDYGIINLPTNIHVSKTDAERITKILKEVFFDLQKSKSKLS